MNQIAPCLKKGENGSILTKTPNLKTKKKKTYIPKAGFPLKKY